MINIIDSVEHILVCYISLLWNINCMFRFTSNSYNNIETICNPISYIQHDIQHYVQQYAISRIASQWCIEYYQKYNKELKKAANQQLMFCFTANSK